MNGWVDWLVVGVVCALLAVTIWRMVKRRKQGGGCHGCSGCSACHHQEACSHGQDSLSK